MKTSIQLNIEDRSGYFFSSMTNINDFDPNLLDVITNNKYLIFGPTEKNRVMLEIIKKFLMRLQNKLNQLLVMK